MCNTFVNLFLSVVCFRVEFLAVDLKVFKTWGNLIQVNSNYRIITTTVYNNVFQYLCQRPQLLQCLSTIVYDPEGVLLKAD